MSKSISYDRVMIAKRRADAKARAQSNSLAPIFICGLVGLVFGYFLALGADAWPTLGRLVGL